MAWTNCGSTDIAGKGGLTESKSTDIGGLVIVWTSQESIGIGDDGLNDLPIYRHC